MCFYEDGYFSLQYMKILFNIHIVAWENRKKSHAFMSFILGRCPFDTETWLYLAFGCRVQRRDSSVWAVPEQSHCPSLQPSWNLLRLTCPFPDICKRDLFDIKPGKQTSLFLHSNLWRCSSLEEQLKFKDY